MSDDCCLLDDRGILVVGKCRMTNLPTSFTPILEVGSGVTELGQSQRDSTPSLSSNNSDSGMVVALGVPEIIFQTTKQEYNHFYKHLPRFGSM